MYNGSDGRGKDYLLVIFWAVFKNKRLKSTNTHIQTIQYHKETRQSGKSKMEKARGEQAKQVNTYFVSCSILSCLSASTEESNSPPKNNPTTTNYAHAHTCVHAHHEALWPRYNPFPRPKSKRTQTHRHAVTRRHVHTLRSARRPRLRRRRRILNRT